MPRGASSWIERAVGRLARELRSIWHRAGRVPGVRGWRGSRLRRLQPLAGGRERGQPVIRYYWEAFLAAHRPDVRGVCLEVGTTQTLTRVGGGAVTRADAIDLAARDGVTVVADLSRADAMPADHYDCFVVPFTLHLVYDLDAAIYHAIRILKPGGVVLASFPCVDACFPTGLDMGTGRPLFVFWQFTPLQVENLLRRCGLGKEDFAVTLYGNLFARTAHQTNLPVEELTRHEREHLDPAHPLLICVRIVKPAHWHAEKPAYRDPWVPATVPVRWQAKTGHDGG